MTDWLKLDNSVAQQKCGRRRITRVEAQRIAHGIREAAERERLEVAQREAERGLDWDALAAHYKSEIEKYPSWS